MEGCVGRDGSQLLCLCEIGDVCSGVYLGGVVSVVCE